MKADNAAPWRPVAVTPILPVTDLERSMTWFRLVEPVDSKPWGTPEFVVEAPEGHRFRIGHGE